MATEKKDNQRAAWGNQIEFILTCVGFAVGLGNVWRFPYLCYRNGGGAFLIPYFICLIFIGIPLFYLELSIGQYASLGPIKVWRVNPGFKGLGYAMVIVSALIAIYYCVIIAWCLYFLSQSLVSELPWIACSNPWNTCYCRDGNQNDSLADPWNGTRTECANVTYNFTSSASEEYWNYNALDISDSITDMGGVKWELAVCLLIAWTITFIVLWRGIKSLGKVVYFTATFPYILLTILLVRGLTLDGYQDGISYYLTPKLDRLMDANAWSDAAVQIFYSLSVCSGGLIAMASYNKFNNLSLRDAFLVPIINCMTSFYAGFVIFSVLGFMAKEKGVTVEEVAKSGPGLAFIVYPEGLAQMPISPLWSVLFFIMMAVLGFSSLFSIVETVITGLVDEMKFLLVDKWKNFAFRLAVCVTGFLLGLPMTARGGYYLFNVMDTYVGGFPLLFVGLFEVIAIIYVYGFFRFKSNIEEMLEHLAQHIVVKISFIYFGVTWIVIAPLGLLAVIIVRAIQYTPIEGEPSWVEAIGVLIILFPLICVPVWFVVDTIRKGPRCTPKDSWGPAKHQNKEINLNQPMTINVVNGINGYNTGSDIRQSGGYTNGGMLSEHDISYNSGYLNAGYSDIMDSGIAGTPYNGGGQPVEYLNEAYDYDRELDKDTTGNIKMCTPKDSWGPAKHQNKEINLNQHMTINVVNGINGYNTGSDIRQNGGYTNGGMLSENDISFNRGYINAGYSDVMDSGIDGKPYNGEGQPVEYLNEGFDYNGELDKDTTGNMKMVISTRL